MITDDYRIGINREIWTDVTILTDRDTPYLQFISNSTSQTAKVQRVTEGDTEYLVAPVTLLVHGVLNGSMGSVYYPLDEISLSCDKWDNIPLVDNHPVLNEVNVSASLPIVQERFGIGSLRYPYIANDGSLKGYAYFDYLKTNKINKKILNALERNSKIEVSTGLKAVCIEKDGSYSGKSYSYVAYDYKPDHLAILIDNIGACSIKDGCGILNQSSVYQFPSGEKDLMALNSTQKSTLVDFIISNCECWRDDGDKQILSSMSDTKLLKLRENILRSNQIKSVANTAVKGFTDGEMSYRLNPETMKWEKPQETKKEEKKEQSIQNKKGQNQSFNEWFANAPPEVQKMYNDSLRITESEKEKIIDELLVNVRDTDKYTQRERLKQRSIEELKSDLLLVPKINNSERRTRKATQQVDDDMLDIPTIDWSKPDGYKEEKQVNNSVNSDYQPVDTSEEDWLMNAPASIRQRLTNASIIEEREKREIINQLTAHIDDEEQEKKAVARLINKSLEELKDIAIISPKQDKRNNYFGGSVPLTNTFNTSADDDVLDLPSFNWQEISNGKK